MVTVKYSSNETEVGFTDSDSSGHQQISDLTEGTFNVTFELPGYKEKYRIITLEDNETRTLDVLLDDYIYDTDGDGIADSDRKTHGEGDIALGESSFPICIQGLMVLVIVLVISLVMYSKIKQENLLKHAQRKRIYDHIMEHPGKHYRAIQSDLDLPMGVLSYHLNRLEKGQYIKSRQDGRYRRFYTRSTKTDMRFFLTDIQESILSIIRDNQGISQTKIANKINVSRKVVHYHINILDKAGLITVESRGRESACFVKAPDHAA
jgi:DNA-binding MarR family transcriptional regulator